MSLWNVNLHLWEGPNFKEVRPERVLIEYDGPVTFTFRDTSQNLMLAHLSDEEDGIARYIVVPILERDVERLLRGTVSLRGVLNQPLVWVLDLKGRAPTQCWVGTFSDLPTNVLPVEDAMLHPDFEPMIKLRVPDVRYRFGAVAVGALRYVIDGAESALRTLVTHLKAESGDHYELEAQQLAFNSIEIAFQPTRRAGSANEPIDKNDKTIPKVERLLASGMKWIASRGEYKLPKGHEKAILTAIRELTPKKDSQIMKIEVSGRVLTDMATSVSLTTDTRIEITEKIKSRRPNSIDRVGVIRELDEDQRSFELREIKQSRNNKPVKFFFDAEQHDRVYRFLGQGNFVRVSGNRHGNKYQLVDLIDQSDLE